MIDAEVLYDGSSGDPTVIWYDGGGTTGWAVISVHPDALMDPDCRVTDNITHYAVGEFYGNEFMQVDQMVNLADLFPGSALGVEQWVHYKSTYGRMDENLTSLARINAAFRYALHLRDIERAAAAMSATGKILAPVTLVDEMGDPIRREPPKVFKQNAALMKGGMPESTLAVVSFSGRSLAEACRGSEHKKDATRHALLFLKRLKQNPQLRKEVFPALYAA